MAPSYSFALYSSVKVYERVVDVDDMRGEG